MILLRRFLVVKTDLCFDILKLYDDIVFIRKTSQFFNQSNRMSHVYDKMCIRDRDNTEIP